VLGPYKPKLTVESFTKSFKNGASDLKRSIIESVSKNVKTAKKEGSNLKRKIVENQKSLEKKVKTTKDNIKVKILNSVKDRLAPRAKPGGSSTNTKKGKSSQKHSNNTSTSYCSTSYPIGWFRIPKSHIC
jgi:hypothetical protein